ncbi:uncharacterized protein LOC115019856 isoform X2 [Cottoperca gobio]|uniref:Uncharacterized protein LOC115019856 isoform X2 n=1 Tax=Cottoperca gobio TaxID=56716 RepID=A0A6J2R542_COTGO|nr:uncharacterized protein LOC115019856 isoform X2 [Cottoperca gobio]
MAVHLRALLLLAGLTGSHSITTVSKVSVKAGDSITIPCLYDSRYINNMKYLCMGYYWSSCSYAVQTNQRNSGKFSISDDKSRRIFTVTIKDLKDTDTDYWCIVVVNGGSDVGKYFQLSVTGGTPLLSVGNQEITGFKGEEITIQCHSRVEAIKWCRLGSSCVTGSSGSIDGTGVNISESGPGVFTVTMSGLRTESSGWYSCVKDDFQMPVHVTVTDRPTTTTPAMTRSLTTLTTRSLTTVSASTVNHNPVSADQALITVQGEQQSRVISFIITLSLLVVIVLVTLFICLMFKRHKQNKIDPPATTTAKEEVTYSTVKKKRKTSSHLHQAEEAVTYSTVKPMRRTSDQRDVDVIYSSVLHVEQHTVHTVEVKDEDVTYSSLALVEKNL